MRWVFASDTHSRHQSIIVPDGDVFVHCGDFSMAGKIGEIQTFGRWVAALPHTHKIVIAGNHDWAFESAPHEALRALHVADDKIHYLQDAGMTIGGVTVWGSPWQPWFYDWAFNLARGPQIAAKWALIPPGTDVVVTHGPPLGILDRVGADEHAGCADLLERLSIVRPKLHAFGHIHEGSGITHTGGTTFVNASICDEAYAPVNPCRIVDM